MPPKNKPNLKPRAAGPKTGLKTGPEPPIDAIDAWPATITKKQIEDVKDQLRMKEKEKAELKDYQEVEKKVFKQKIRHLLYENQLHISTLKEEAERAYMAKRDEYRQEEVNAQRHVRDIKLMDRNKTCD
eukprot:gene5249-3760_t